jgi:hypothetical protein
VLRKDDMKTHSCNRCGRYVKTTGCLCSFCSNHQTENNPEAHTWDTVTEMHEGNYSKRLSEGFAMLNEDY